MNKVYVDLLKLRTIVAGAPDEDDDGFANLNFAGCDNCPGVANSTQLDTDVDGDGDACDNCPAVINPSQQNSDGDTFGDACDICPGDPNNDIDQDGVCHPPDNCPSKPNADQSDEDDDGVGDACDWCVDPDHDEYGTVLGQPMICPADNCPYAFNPNQADSDGDGHGNACDNCPTVSNNQLDGDNDGIGNACDPCWNNGVCQPGENCGNCSDCPSGVVSVAACPNGQCETADGEDCLTCPDDCNFKQNGPAAGRYCCSDGTVGGVTNPVTCSDPRCTAQGNTCLSTPAVSSFCCGTGVCQAGETCTSCPVDCVCPP